MEKFEELVKQAVASLPQAFKEKLENVDIVIEDLPGPGELASLGIDQPLSLFGLYQGIPQTQRGNNYMFVAPDKITIYKLPIVLTYQTPEAIKRKVRAVVLHEIGHHFGLSESDMTNKSTVQ